MSKTVDSRIVEMQFNNSDFEKNVKMSMDTLSNLRSQLENLDKSSTSLESLGKAASSASGINELGSSVEQVSGKFSTLEEVAIGALRRIGEKAADIGMSFAKSLTIDNVAAGFSEYETKMTSVQTLVNATGEDLETVKSALEELNKYADDTIYSFSDMTSNMAKFANAGVDLETAKEAIKGISNWAGYAGANAQEASRAMYNISQSMSGGYMQLIDWKSVKFANMATQPVMKEMIATAEKLGTVIRNTDGTFDSTTTNLKGKLAKNLTMQQMFNDGLQHQWLTTEVLMESMEHFSKDVNDMTAAEKEAYETKLRGLGYTQEEIAAIEELGTKANGAAKDVKTFSMLIDTLKEAVGSGWAQTFEYLFGDLEEAKKLWTSVSLEAQTIIGNIADWRNGILKEWKQSGGRDAIIEGFGNIYKAIKNFVKPVKEAFNEIFNGDVTAKILELSFRFRDFTKGLAENTELCDSVKEAFKGLFSVIKAGGAVIKSLWIAATPLLKIAGKLIGLVVQSAGYLGELISDFLGVEDAMEGINSVGTRIAGTIDACIIPLQNFMENIHQIFSINYLREGGGLIGIFSVIYDTIVSVIRLMFELFSVITGVDVTTYEDNVINSLGDFKHKLFEQLNSIKDFLSKFSLKELFGKIFNLDEIRKDYEKFGGGLNGVFAALTETLARLFSVIVEVIEGFTGLDLSKLRDNISKSAETIITSVIQLEDSLKDGTFIIKARDIGINIVRGIGNGMSDGVKSLFTPIRNVFNYIIDKFCEIFKIHSPSLETADRIGKWITAGIGQGIEDFKQLLNGPVGEVFKYLSKSILLLIGSGLELVTTAITGLTGAIKALNSVVKESGIGEKLKRWISDKDFEAILKQIKSLLVMVTGLLMITNLVKLMETVNKATSNVNSIFKNISKDIAAITKTIQAYQKTARVRMYVNIFKNLAISVGLIAGSIYILGKGLNTSELKRGAIAVGIIAGAIWSIFTTLTVLGTILPKSLKAMNTVNNLGKFMLSIGASLFLISSAIKKISKIRIEEWEQTRNIFALIGVWIVAVVDLIMLGQRLLNEEGRATNVWASILAVGASLYLIATSIKKLGKMEEEDLIKGTVAIDAVIAFLGLLILAINGAARVNTSGRNAFEQLAVTLIALGVCVRLLASAIKAIGYMDADAMWRGLDAIIAIMGFMSLVMYAGKKAKKAWKSLLSIASLFIAFGLVIKVVGEMAPEDVIKGFGALIVLSGMIIGLLLVIRKISKSKVNATPLFGIAACLIAMGAVVAGVAYIADKVEEGSIKKALWSILAITAIVAGLLYVLKFVDASKVDTKPLKGITICIVALGGVTAAIAYLTRNLSTEQFDRSTQMMVSFIFWIGLFLAAYKKIAGAGKMSIAPIVAFTVMLTALTASLAALYFIDDPDGIMRISLSLAAAIGAIGVAIYAAGKIKNVSMKGLIAGTVALAVIGGIIIILAQQKAEWKLVASIGGSMAACFVALGAAMKMAKDIKLNDAAAIVLAATAMVAIGYALSLIGNLDWKNLLGTAVSLAGVFGAMVFFSLMLGEASGNLFLGAAVMIAMAGAIFIIAAGFKQLENVNWATILAAAGAISVMITVMSVVAQLLGDAAPMSAIGMAILLGVAAACYILAAALDRAYTGIANFINAISTMMATLMAVFTAENAQNILGFFTSLADGMVETTQYFVERFVDTVNLIKEKTPEIEQALDELINAIADAMVRLANTIDERGVEVSAAFAKMIADIKKTFTEGLGVDSSTSTEFQNYGGFICKGLVNGLQANGPSAIKALTGIGVGMISSFTNLFQIHSPSRLMYTIAGFIVTGIVKGIRDKKGEAAEEGKSLGESVENGVLTGVKSLLNGDIGKKIVDSLGLDLGNMDTDSINELVGNLTSGKIDLSGIEGLSDADISGFIGQLKDAGYEVDNINLGVDELLNKNGEKELKVTADTSSVEKAIKDVMAGKYGNGNERFTKLAKEYTAAQIAEIQNGINKALGNSKVHSASEYEKYNPLKDAKKNNAVIYGSDEYYKQSGESINNKKVKPVVYGTDEYYKQAELSINNKKVVEETAAAQAKTTAEVEKTNAAVSKTVSANEANKNATTEAAKAVKYGSDEYYKQAQLSINNKRTVEETSAAQEKTTKEVQKTTDATKELKKATDDAKTAVIYGSDEYYKQAKESINNKKANLETTATVEVKPEVVVKTVDAEPVKTKVTEAVEAEVKDIQAKVEIEPVVDTSKAEQSIESFKKKTEDLSKSIPESFKGVETEIAKFMSTISNTINTKGTEVEKSCKNVFEKAVDATAKMLTGSSTIAKFTNAGKQVINGFVKGINSKKIDVAKAGKAIADTAVKSTSNKLKIKSPSRVFKKIGEFVGSGLVLGIRSMFGSVDAASSDMGKEASDGIMNSLDMAFALLENNDFNPIITPVVDLSNVQNGMNTISNLTSMKHAASISADFTATKSYNDQQQRYLQTQFDNLSKNMSDMLSAMNTESEVPVNVNVSLEGDANGLFRAVKSQNSTYKKMHGKSAFA